MKLMDPERHAIVEHHGGKVVDDGLGWRCDFTPSVRLYGLHGSDRPARLA
jgi:hypothetical protein